MNHCVLAILPTLKFQGITNKSKMILELFKVIKITMVALGHNKCMNYVRLNHLHP